MTNTPLSALNLPARAYNCLQYAGFKTVDDVVAELGANGWRNIFQIKNFAGASCNHLRHSLELAGLWTFPDTISETWGHKPEKPKVRIERELGATVYLLKSEIEALSALELPETIRLKLTKAATQLR